MLCSGRPEAWGQTVSGMPPGLGLVGTLCPGTPFPRPCLDGCCASRSPQAGRRWDCVWSGIASRRPWLHMGVVSRTHRQNLAWGVVPRIYPPVLDLFDGVGLPLGPWQERACAQDPYLPIFGLVGACSWTPTQDYPPQPSHPLSIRALRLPPTLRHISSGAAPHPSPPLPPFSRWPPRCGTSRARAPPPPAAPAGPGSPSAAAAVAAAAAAQSDAGRGRGPGSGAGCTRASLLRSPEDSVPGAGARPSRLSSPPQPRPLVRRLLDMQRGPAPARRLAAQAPPLGRRPRPHAKHDPAFPGAATAPPRPLAGP